MNLSQEEIALYTQEAREHLLPYALLTKPDLKVTRFVKALCLILENALAGKYDGKIILLEAPPRHTKSEIVSRTFPAWANGKNPDLDVICVSNVVTLAEELTDDVRARMEMPIHAEIFGDNASLNPKKSARGNFASKGGGKIFAVGVGGVVIGKGADILIIDDPVESRRQIESPTERDHIYTWLSGMMTRLNPDGPKIIILMHQRWHSDDPAGRLLRDKPDEVIRFSFPAIIESEDDKKRDSLNREIGEALAPNWMSAEDLLTVKRRLTDPRDWPSMYLCDPRPIGNMRFNPKLLRPREVTPAYAKSNMTVYLIGDGATGKNAKTDFSAFGAIGLSADRSYTILDMVRERLSLEERWKKFKELHSIWQPKPGNVYYEQYGASSDIDFFELQMKEDKYFFDIKNIAYVNHSSKKGTKGEEKDNRIEALIPQMADNKWFKQDNLYREYWNGSEFVKYQPIEEMIKQEMMTWPSAANDDGLDMLGRINDIEVEWPSGIEVNTPKKIKSPSPW